MPTPDRPAAAPLPRLIRESGLTQRALAERSGIALRNINRIAQGLIDPQLTTARKILDAIGKRWSDMDEPPVEKKSSKKFVGPLTYGD
jgi:predicted transcriptional regulator